MRTSLLERQLLLSAKASDLGTIINIVKDLSAQEKSSINPQVLDTVVDSIIHYAKFDRAESAYTMMLFVRLVGAHISPASMTAMLQAIPPAVPQIASEKSNVKFLPRERVTAV